MLQILFYAFTVFRDEKNWISFRQQKQIHSFSSLKSSLIGREILIFLKEYFGHIFYLKIRLTTAYLQ